MVTKPKSPMKKLKIQPNNESMEISNSLIEELRKCIWPVYDHDKFKENLQLRPNIVNSRHGNKQETLLHR